MWIFVIFFPDKGENVLDVFEGKLFAQPYEMNLLQKFKKMIDQISRVFHELLHHLSCSFWQELEDTRGNNGGFFAFVTSLRKPLHVLQSQKRLQKSWSLS
jgi:hypothetical protein